jgi:hypothetical protein
MEEIDLGLWNLALSRPVLDIFRDEEWASRLEDW